MRVEASTQATACHAASTRRCRSLACAQVWHVLSNYEHLAGGYVATAVGRGQTSARHRTGTATRHEKISRPAKQRDEKGDSRAGSRAGSRAAAGLGVVWMWSNAQAAAAVTHIAQPPLRSHHCNLKPPSEITTRSHHPQPHNRQCVEDHTHDDHSRRPKATPRTENREPRTENREPRTENRIANCC